MTGETPGTDRESRPKPPPLDEDPGKGQFYFPGRPKGCLVLLALALLAVAAGAAAAASRV